MQEKQQTVNPDDLISRLLDYVERLPLEGSLLIAEEAKAYLESKRKEEPLHEILRKILGKEFYFDGPYWHTVFCSIADEAETRGRQGKDLDPGETADWLRKEANTVLKDL